MLENKLLVNLVVAVLRAGWNYDILGADVWIEYPNACGLGQKQSPINIITAATAYDSTLAGIAFKNYSNLIQWNVSNNGHTS